MTVLTGRSGQLFVNGTRAAKCIGWSLDESRPMLESTTVDVWDRTVVPGRRSGTGTAKLLYDPEDAGAAELFDSILLNGISELPITMFLDQATGEGYPVAVHVSSASHAVSRGAAQSRDISFRLSDVGIELEIIGSEKAAIGVTQLYTGAVYGIDGAWTYLWTSSGPVIANPTSQTTNITFDTLGTFTLTLTATLGLTVLTDTHVVEVIDVPLMWLSKPTYLMDNTGRQNEGAAAIDPVNQYVYQSTMSFPDISVSEGETVLTRFDYLGNRLATRRILGLDRTTPGDVEAASSIHPLADGGVFVSFCRSSNTHIMRFSADMATIVWRSKINNTSFGGWQFNGSTYDSSANRIYFSSNGTSASGADTFRGYLGYVDLATGAITRVGVTPSPIVTMQGCKPLLLSGDRVLFCSQNSNTIYFIECSRSLQVGGIYAPIRVVEHQFSGGVASGLCTPIETDNYIALVHSNNSGAIIGLYNKADYSHVKTRDCGKAQPGLFSCFYYAGQFNFLVTQSPFGATPVSAGWTAHKVSEDLTSHTSQVSITQTGTGVLSWRLPLRALRSSGMSVESGNNFDPALGLFAVHTSNRQTDNLQQEMFLFHRASYGANVTLNYGARTMNVTAQTPGLVTGGNPNGLNNTLLTVTTTINRTWAFNAALLPNPTVAATITTEADGRAYSLNILA